MRRVLGHRHDRFLDQLLGFVVTQALLQGKAMNQPPVRVKKVPPTLVILPVLEARQ